MATLKQRLHRKNASGTYDVVHLETSASCVLMANGTTVETAINDKAPSSHNHTKNQITDFPTSLPASDVYSWAKASSKPSYAWSEITGKPSSFAPATHSHDVVSTIAAGFAPVCDGSTTKFLRADGTWAVPPDTNTVYTHPNSGVTAGTYRSVTVNAAGHVTAGSNPTVTVAQGGTGKSTLTSGSFLKGNGTGAVTLRTPEQVLSDIGAATAVTYSATVTATWTASGNYFYQDITVSGILATDNPIVDINPDSDNAANVLYSEAICKVFRITTSANQVRVWATEAIATAFPIQLKVVR